MSDTVETGNQGSGANGNIQPVSNGKAVTPADQVDPQMSKTFVLDHDIDLAGELSSDPPRKLAPGENPAVTDTPAPLQRPTLRVQGTDIILEEEAAATSPPLQQQQPPSETPVDINIDSLNSSNKLKLVEEQTKDDDTGNKQTGAATINTAAAQGHSQPPTHLDTIELKSPSGMGSQRLHRMDSDLRGSSHSSDILPRVKQPSTLTSENVTVLNKTCHGTAKVDHSTRMWMWLKDAGPPYDASPSLAISNSGKINAGAPVNIKTDGSKGWRRFLCFSCTSNAT